jgi:hypothetical protein
MAATVADLIPGDLVTLPGAPVSGVFVARCPHPLYGGLMLVIWRLSDGTWNHDTLIAWQEVGDVQPGEPAARRERLRAALSDRGWNR